MRLSLRFILPLLVVLGLVAYAVVPIANSLTLRWFVRDLDLRSTLIAGTVQEPLQDLLQTGNRTRLLQFFARARARHERSGRAGGRERNSQGGAKLRFLEPQPVHAAVELEPHFEAHAGGGISQ